MFCQKQQIWEKKKSISAESRCILAESEYKLSEYENILPISRYIWMSTVGVFWLSQSSTYGLQYKYT
jgi:hypothetical protein